MDVSYFLPLVCTTVAIALRIIACYVYDLQPCSWEILDLYKLILELLPPSGTKKTSNLPIAVSGLAPAILMYERLYNIFSFHIPFISLNIIFPTWQCSHMKTVWVVQLVLSKVSCYYVSAIIFLQYLMFCAVFFLRNFEVALCNSYWCLCTYVSLSANTIASIRFSWNSWLWKQLTKLYSLSAKLSSFSTVLFYLNDEYLRPLWS